ncbi:MULTISPECIES: hypothetical protein [Prochlorococcus]|uniref:hypothetical protein n=1 Tax=Prochlorococcus TaxID=1218 RepID=UPI00187C242B|nr:MULTISPECIES: hypothetical protein [Prochlorococcus]
MTLFFLWIVHNLAMLNYRIYHHGKKQMAENEEKRLKAIERLYPKGTYIAR